MISRKVQTGSEEKEEKILVISRELFGLKTLVLSFLTLFLLNLTIWPQNELVIYY